MIFFKKYGEGLKKVEAPNIFTTGFQRKNMGRYYVTRKISVILDANNELSIQVHPNDENANNKENGMEGKTECWYIIHCEEGSEIVLGHYANTKEELINLKISTGTVCLKE